MVAHTRQVDTIIVSTSAGYTLVRASSFLISRKRVKYFRSACVAIFAILVNYSRTFSYCRRSRCCRVCSIIRDFRNSPSMKHSCNCVSLVIVVLFGESFGTVKSDCSTTHMGAHIR